MATQQFSTGPAFIYAGAWGNNAPQYLGTTVSTPRISNRPQWKPVFSDSHGQNVPADVSYQNQDAMITCQFSRFDHKVIDNIRTYVSNSTIKPGTSLEGSVGALMITEGVSRRLWIRWPFQAKSAYAILEPGRRYLHSYLIGPDDIDEAGTNPLIISLTWHCIPIWTPSALGGVHTLYDTDMQGLPVPA